MTNATNFKEATKHHDELGERQLEILALIDEGLSNGEIAAALGLSLDETKRNVSAVLTKLGLARREDAAAYYRWRQAPLRRIGRHAQALAFGVRRGSPRRRQSWRWRSGAARGRVAGGAADPASEWYASTASVWTAPSQELFFVSEQFGIDSRHRLYRSERKPRDT